MDFTFILRNLKTLQPCQCGEPPVNGSYQPIVGEVSVNQNLLTTEADLHAQHSSSQDVQGAHEFERSQSRNFGRPAGLLYERFMQRRSCLANHSRMCSCYCLPKMECQNGFSTPHQNWLWGMYITANATKADICNRILPVGLQPQAPLQRKSAGLMWHAIHASISQKHCIIRWHKAGVPQMLNFFEE